MVVKEEEPVNIGLGKGNLSTVNLYADKMVVTKIPVTESSKVLASPIQSHRFQTMHNTEVLIYTILQNHPEAKIRYPHIFEKMEMNLAENQTGYLKMEYIDQCQHVFLFENLRVENLIEPIRQIARFHAIELTKEEKEKVPKNMLTTWMAELFCEKNMTQFMSVWTNQMKSFVSPETVEISKLLPKILTLENLQKWNDDTTIPAVLCHGDYCSSNILFEKTTRNLKSICDFQCSNIGNGMQDLTRLLVTSLSGKDRRENTKYLLEEYCREWEKFKNPIDFEKIEKSFEIFLVFNAAVTCISSVGTFLLRLKNADDDETRKKISEAMCEKYTLLLEDIKLYWTRHFVDQSTIR